MQFIKTLALALCTTLTGSVAIAQTEQTDTAAATTNSKKDKGNSFSIGGGDGAPEQTPVGHWYLSNAFDGAIFSTAVMERPGDRRMLTTPRFSALNIGYHFNYDFDEHFGIFTGLGIKNIGFIEKVDRPNTEKDSTVKRRVYTIGVPLGFKLGNLAKKHYGFIGGGIDVPFNYREKGFVNRGDKKKFNEFWSRRTPEYMPYIFAGFAYGKGSTIKVQYYPGNFFNTEYNETFATGPTMYPYRGYNVHLLYVTLGIDVRYKMHGKKAAEGDGDEKDEAPQHPSSPTGM